MIIRKEFKIPGPTPDQDDTLIVTFNVLLAQTHRLPPTDPEAPHRGLPDYRPLPAEFFTALGTERPDIPPSWDERGQPYPMDHFYPAVVNGSELVIPMDPRDSGSAFSLQFTKPQLSTASGRTIVWSNASFAIVILNDDGVCLSDGQTYERYEDIVLTPQTTGWDGSIRAFANYLTVEDRKLKFDDRNMLGNRLDGPQLSHGVSGQFYFSATPDSATDDDTTIKVANRVLKIVVIPLKRENIKCKFAEGLSEDEIVQTPDPSTRSLTVSEEVAINAGAKFAQECKTGGSFPSHYDLGNKCVVTLNIVTPEAFIARKATSMSAAAPEACHDDSYTFLPIPVVTADSLVRRDYRHAKNSLLEAMAAMTPLVYLDPDKGCLVSPSNLIEVLFVQIFCGRLFAPDALKRSKVYTSTENENFLIFNIQGYQGSRNKFYSHLAIKMLFEIQSLGYGEIKLIIAPGFNIYAYKAFIFQIPHVLIVHHKFIRLFQEAYHNLFKYKPEAIQELVSQFRANAPGANEANIDRLEKDAKEQYVKLGGVTAYEERTGIADERRKLEAQRENIQRMFEAQQREEERRKALQEEEERAAWAKLKARELAAAERREAWMKLEREARASIGETDTPWYSLDDDAASLSPAEAMVFLNNYFADTGLNLFRTALLHYLLMTAFQKTNFPLELYLDHSEYKVSYTIPPAPYRQQCMVERRNIDPRLTDLIKDNVSTRYIITDTGIWYWRYVADKPEYNSILIKLNVLNDVALSELRQSLKVNVLKPLEPYQAQITAITGHSDSLPEEVYIHFNVIFKYQPDLAKGTDRVLHCIQKLSLQCMRAIGSSYIEYDNAGLSPNKAIITLDEKLRDGYKYEFCFHPKVVASAQFLLSLRDSYNKMFVEKPHILRVLCQQQHDLSHVIPAIWNEDLEKRAQEAREAAVQREKKYVAEAARQANEEKRLMDLRIEREIAEARRTDKAKVQGIESQVVAPPPTAGAGGAAEAEAAAATAVAPPPRAGAGGAAAASFFHPPAADSAAASPTTRDSVPLSRPGASL
jgi:hypothetical protein